MVYVSRALLLVILTAFCMACGQKGPLYLPEKPAAEPKLVTPPPVQDPIYAN